MKNSIVVRLASAITGTKAQIASLLFLLTMGMPSFVKAQDGIQPAGSVHAAIRYVGTTDDQLVFKIEIDNQGTEAYSIKIRDEEGNTFFEEKFKDKKFSKKFAIKKEDAGELLTFIIKSSKEQQIETFQIDRNIRVIEDLVITKQ